MSNMNQNGDKSSLASTQKYEFKYIESSYVDGREMSTTEKTWTADSLADYNRFREIWQKLETFDEHYRLDETGSLIEDGYVAMTLDCTFELLGATVKNIRGISYKIAE